MNISEKQISDSIVSLFQAKGLYIQRVNAGSVQNMATGTWLKLADKGHSDLIASDSQNRICFIEVKSETGKLSQDQVYFLREQNRKNRRWCVAVSYEDALRFLEDDTFHGAEKYVREITDESSRFVVAPHKRNAKLNISTFLAFNRHADGK